MIPMHIFAVYKLSTFDKKKRGGRAEIENAFGWKRNSIIAASDRQRKLFFLFRAWHKLNLPPF